MNIKKILAVLLTVAIVLVSAPIAATAYTVVGEPECYLTDFNTANWGIHTGPITFDNDAGTISVTNSNLAVVKYKGTPLDLSKGFAFQYKMVIQGDGVDAWGNASWILIGDMRIRIYNAISSNSSVLYGLEKDGVEIATHNTRITHENGTAPLPEYSNVIDGFFTITYNDGKIQMYNENIKSEDNPTGIITWKLKSNSTYTTEITGWEDDDFKECSPIIEKGRGGQETEHVILSDLYVCDYDFFINNEKPVFEKQTQVNIACIGDSITEGVGTYSGYRYYLFENLYKQGLKFNFVGPYTSTDSRLPSAYYAHAGYSGAVIGPNCNSGARSSYDFLPYYVAGDTGTADIALVMLGHNNYYQKIDIDNIDEVYKKFILRIFELAPDITVYCGTMVNTTTGMSPDVEKGYTDTGLNALIPGVVKELQDEGYDVKFFDLQKATNLSGENGDFNPADGVHPNEQGQKKIGDAWAGVIADQIKTMNDANEGGNTTKIVPTISICLDTKEINLTAGSYRRRLYADVQMSAATVDTVLWTSSDPDVATVDIDGLVTPLSEGECTITATTLSGGFTSSCKVNVAPAVSQENELKTAFSDIFTLPERWIGGGFQGLGDNGIHIWFPGQGNYTQYDTRRHYKVEKEFKLSANYTVAGNEASFSNYTYTSFGFAGLEMRLAYGAKTIELYHNDTLLGKWTHSYEGGAHQYDLHYNDGKALIIRDNEIVVEATVPFSELPETSPVKFYSGEFNRFASTHSIKFETLTLDENYAETSPVDTDDKSDFETVIDGFDAENWTVVAEGGSIGNDAVYAPKTTTYVEFDGDNYDVSKGFQMKFDFNWNNYTRYYGESIYFTLGDVTLRIRNAYDTTQARNYPLYLCVYENSTFDEATGAFLTGDIVATMISNARGQVNQSNSDMLNFMNATYTLYYDGQKLYIKNSNLGTIKFTLADGSLDAGIPIDAAQFADSGVQIYKEAVGNAGNTFSNFSLTALEPTVVLPPDVIGDADGDYEVTSADVLALAQHLLDIKVIDNVGAKCDFNEDGIVDTRDLVVLEMNILGWASLDANQNYLGTVSYLDYELTGQKTPTYIGRWFRKEIGGRNHMVTVNDGSMIYFLVKGATTVDVSFTITTGSDIPYYTYSIDGATPVRKSVSDGTITLPDTGRHTVRIITDGLTETVKKWDSEEGFAISGITSSKGGEILGIRPKNKVVFFYGDSITEGVCSISKGFYSSNNSATNAYTWFCSQKLGVVPYYVGYSGSGIIANGSLRPFETAINSFTKNYPAEETATPDVIVINHGTNDGGSTDDAFKTGLTNAIATLREKYPDKPIVYMIPIRQTKAAVIREVMSGVENSYVVETSDWDISTNDGIHPDSAGAQKMGENLAAELENIFGANYFA